MRYTPEHIVSLEPNQILVFGSNQHGQHGKGLAKLAMTFGAVYGVAEGLQGQTYAIVTKRDWRRPRSSSLPEIGRGIQTMLLFAKDYPELEFLVTKIASGLAGYSISEIRELFVKLKKWIPNNVVLPREYEVRS